MTAPGPRGASLGLSCFARGQRFVFSRPRLLLLGLLPALVVFVVLVALLITLTVFSVDIAGAITPFADGWDTAARELLRGLLAAALVGAAAFVAYLLFVSLTLVAGQPVYEHISRQLERELGAAPAEPDEPWHAGIRRAIAETVRLLVRSVPWALLVFLVGLLPVVGQLAGVVLGALVGGRFLAIELITPAMEQRRRYLDDRLALAHEQRAAVLGLGVPVFVCSLVPLLGVVLMPGAVAGGTLLVRALTPVASPAR